jgi:hypothetical protein
MSRSSEERLFVAFEALVDAAADDDEGPGSKLEVVVEVAATLDDLLLPLLFLLTRPFPTLLRTGTGDGVRLKIRGELSLSWGVLCSACSRNSFKTTYKNTQLHWCYTESHVTFIKVD